jgi:endonuclease/exonuclease/phosphatase family metal-dependent hydrolase
MPSPAIEKQYPNGGSIMECQALWLEHLRKYKTLDALRQSDFFADCGERIERFLKTAQIIPFPGSAPRLHSFLRVAQWNIEKGKRFNAILKRLQTSEILKWADVLILNEADQGMNRSGNLHVARALAENLQMHTAFGPAHFELTKGTDDELALEGENRESLQGNAVLSRYPVLEACVVPLPASFEPYEFQEKRFGGRSCLWVRLQLRQCSLWVGSVHLELRNTPRDRAGQMRHVLEHLPGGDGESYLLGGDLNTNSFGRGTAWRTARSVARLLSSSLSRLNSQLLHPERGKEPLFKALTRHGFIWEGLNSYEETARADIYALEEVGFLPAALLKPLQRRLEAYQGYLCFKLDWLLGKNVLPLSGGQKKDMVAGVGALGPACLKGGNAGPDRISDHLPIYADLDLA